MLSKFNVLDRSGHTVIERPSVEEMNAEFDRLVSEGHLAYTERGGENVQIKRGEWNPAQDETVTFVPPFVGG